MTSPIDALDAVLTRALVPIAGNLPEATSFRQALLPTSALRPANQLNSAAPALWKPRRRVPQGQHFLLSAKSRTLSVKQVMRMPEEEARAEFRRRRWPDSDGAPVCPHCSSERCYELCTRRALRCARCRRNFTETSGTIFHSAKLELRDYLAVIALFVNAHKGISALQVARDVGISHKAAFVILHKLREAIEHDRSNLRLGGEIEVDGAYYLGKVRQPNAGRFGRRPEWKGRKLCVLAFRQRDGATVTKVVETERTELVMGVAAAHVLPGSTIYADEHAAYDALHAKYRTLRINHRWSYSEDGASTNIAESFHARMRRGARGQYHRFSARHLHAYAAELAYREDRRRADNGAVFGELIEMALSHPASVRWRGAWQKAAGQVCTTDRQ